MRLDGSPRRLHNSPLRLGWARAALLQSGPARAPGRFQVIARATTDGNGEFRFAPVPRGSVLMVRARPRAPYQETYSDAPFVSDQSAREVTIVLRGGP